MVFMDKKIEQFVNGIFNLQTRRFGTLAEIIIRKKYGFKESGRKEFDAIDKDGQEVEIKFARVVEKRKNTITEKNVIEEVTNEISIYERAIPSTNVKASFDVNIEQVKPENFKYLIYGLFFKDCVKIYSIKPSELSSVSYNDKQHPAEGNQIEEGQFHIKNTNILNHKDYLKDVLAYEEIYELLNK